jgi:hypothetical protein
MVGAPPAAPAGSGSPAIAAVRPATPPASSSVIDLLQSAAGDVQVISTICSLPPAG